MNELGQIVGVGGDVDGDHVDGMAVEQVRLRGGRLGSTHGISTQHGRPPEGTELGGRLAKRREVKQLARFVKFRVEIEINPASMSDFAVVACALSSVAIANPAVAYVEAFTAAAAILVVLYHGTIIATDMQEFR